MSGINDNAIASQILEKSKNIISLYLKINSEQFQSTLQNAVIRKKLSGHNNQVHLVDFFDGNGNILGSVCLKYSLNEKLQSGLITEANILKILHSENINICPKIIDLDTLVESNITYIVMETANGNLINCLSLKIETMNKIFDLILFHESVLLEKASYLNSPSVVRDLHRKINFNNKITKLLTSFVPNFTIKNSLSFLNYYLNSKHAISQRAIVTDRSVENIFQNKNNDIILIDFSTIRVGTQFDNWIQFIDDPRASFSFPKEDLITILFERNKLNTKLVKLFYSASVYTNLLQGIFTYEKNPKLGINYFKNANKSFSMLKKKKGVLIDISH